MNTRKNKEKPREGIDSTGLSDKDKEKAEEVNKTSQSTDRLREENALLAAVMENNEVCGYSYMTCYITP